MAKIDPQAVSLFVHFVRLNPDVHADDPIFPRVLNAYSLHPKPKKTVNPNQLKLAVDQ